MKSLDIDTVTALLKDEIAQAAVKTTGHKRPVQIGPLGWAEQESRCTARGCGSPTYVTVKGIHFCTSHALYALNHMIIEEHELSEPDLVIISDCTCKAGKHSMGNIHTDDCPIFQRVKDQRDNTSTTNKSSTTIGEP